MTIRDIHLPSPGQHYRCYTLSTPRDKAIDAFVSRYHHQPNQVFEHAQMLWLGPIHQPEQDPHVLFLIQEEKL